MFAGMVLMALVGVMVPIFVPSMIMMFELFIGVNPGVRVRDADHGLHGAGNPGARRRRRARVVIYQPL